MLNYSADFVYVDQKSTGDRYGALSRSSERNGLDNFLPIDKRNVFSKMKRKGCFYNFHFTYPKN